MSLEQWIRMNLKFKQERDNMIVKDMKDNKNKSELKRDLKISKAAKVKDKALDFFKNGIGRIQSKSGSNFPKGYK